MKLQFLLFIFSTIVCTFNVNCSEKRDFLECSPNNLIRNPIENEIYTYCLLYIGCQNTKVVGTENGIGLDQEIFTFLMNKDMPKGFKAEMPHIRIEYSKDEWEKVNMSDDQFINPTKDKEPNRTIISKELFTTLLCFKEQKRFFPRPIQHKILSFTRGLLPGYINNQHIISHTTLMGYYYNNKPQLISIPGTFLLKRIPERNEFELRRFI